MSETPPTAPPVKIKLTTLLEKVNQILSEPGAVEGSEGYHAPTVTVLQLMRIHLTRDIEHTLATRTAIAAIRNLLKAPDLKEGEEWKSDLPALREEMKEVKGLLKEIFQVISAQMPGGGEAAAPVEAQPDAPSNGSNGNGAPKTPEELAALAQQAQLDELAKQMAGGQPVNLAETMAAVPAPIESLIPVAPVAPVTQIDSKKKRNPAGNEKIQSS